MADQPGIRVSGEGAREMSDWDYTGYWNVVIGADRTPRDTVIEFDLAADRVELDEWLGTCASEAISAGLTDPDDREETLEAWEQFHARALDDLMEAAEDVTNV